MRQLTLACGRVITLNEEQNQAMTLLENWMNNPHDLFFLLSGYAGTGKTTLVKELLNYIDDTSRIAVAVTAPTHKAKRVISEATGLSGFTIQKCLGLGLDTDISTFDPAQPQFKQKYTPLMPNYRLVVMDEGSMINSELLRHILRVAKTHCVKILFMADKAQLPPVNEQISEIFSHEDIRSKFQLTKVERQAGDNPLMSVYDKIRSNLRSATDMFSKQTNFTDQNEGIGFLNAQEFQDGALLSYTSEAFDADPSHCKVLAWTNEEVGKWNRLIRKHRMNIIHEGAPTGAINRGDLMMAYATRENYIVNSNEYMVLSASLQMLSMTYPNMKGPGTKTTTVPYISAQAVDIDTQKAIELRIINPRDKAAIAIWVEMYYAFIGKAKKDPKLWADYFTFRGKLLLMEDLAYPNVKRDIDFGYALTVHRSQGSTYNEVYVVEPDINKNRKNTERNQLKYVALSRPRQRAYVLNR